MQLITHRGIDVAPGDSRGWSLQESRWESFSEQIRAGWGLEFDVRPLKDNQFAISHDSGLARIVPGIDRKVSSLTRNEFKTICAPGGRLCFLDELLDLIAGYGRSMSALHLKSHCHDPSTLNKILEVIEPRVDSLIGRLLIFDASPQVARQIVRIFPGLDVAASVAHSFDVLRYGGLAGGTLLTCNQALDHGDVYSWAWFDEWDTLDVDNGQKTFVNRESVDQFKNHGFKVAVVSPELHATSPALLGGEAHKDGVEKNRLASRWRQFHQLGVDALCTDHASWISENLSAMICASG